MNNLPNGAEFDMRAPWNQPVRWMDVEECAECGLYFAVEEMHPWRRYNTFHRMVMDVHLCDTCVPRCGWLHDEHGRVRLDLKPCGRIQSPDAQGPWCAEHDAESMRLDESEG